VEAMGGEIAVTSAHGHGATFAFTATFDAPEHPAVALTPPTALHGLRALIVDDNQTNRTILAHQLAGAGIDTDEASDAATALAALRRETAAGHPYQLALIDMQMPRRNGLQLAEDVTADPALAGIRMILMTSLSRWMDPAALHAAGFAAFLSKPVKTGALLDVMLQVLSGKPVSPMHPADAVINAPGNGAHVLLVEDNKANQMVASLQLKKLGCTVDVVANGLEAVEATLRIPYDMVFMDCLMPEMDGYAATQEIRRREGRSRHTPIIAMTANVMAGDRERCLAVGMDDYISKPIQRDQLITVLRRAAGTAEAATATSAPNATPEPVSVLVDEQRLEGTFEGDVPAMQRLLNLYLTETDSELRLLAEAIARHDQTEAHRLSHGLAGASESFGMRGVAQPLRSMEARLKQGDFSDAATLLDDARQRFAATSTYLAQTHLKTAGEQAA